MNIQNYLQGSGFQLGTNGMTPGAWANPSKPFQEGWENVSGGMPVKDSSNKVNQVNNFRVIHSCNLRPFSENVEGQDFAKDWHRQLFSQLLFCVVSKQDKSDKRFKMGWGPGANNTKRQRVMSQHGTPVSLVHIHGANYMLARFCDEFFEKKNRNVTYPDILQHFHIAGVGITPEYTQKAYPEGVQIHNIVSVGKVPLQNIWGKEVKPNDQLFIIMKPMFAEKGDKIPFNFSPERLPGYVTTSYTFKNKCTYFQFQPWHHMTDLPSWEMVTAIKSGGGSSLPLDPGPAAAAAPPLVAPVLAVPPPGAAPAAAAAAVAAPAAFVIPTSPFPDAETALQNLKSVPDRFTNGISPDTNENKVTTEPDDSRMEFATIFLAEKGTFFIRNLKQAYSGAEPWQAIGRYILYRCGIEKTQLAIINILGNMNLGPNPSPKPLTKCLEEKMNTPGFKFENEQQVAFYVYELIRETESFNDMTALTEDQKVFLAIIAYFLAVLDVDEGRSFAQHFQDASKDIFNVYNRPEVTTFEYFKMFLEKPGNSTYYTFLRSLADENKDPQDRTVRGFLGPSLNFNDPPLYRDGDRVVGYWWRVGQCRELINVGGAPHPDLIVDKDVNLATDYGASRRAKAIEIFFDGLTAMNIPM